MAKVTNALAYSGTQFIAVVKIFVEHVLGAMALSIITSSIMTLNIMTFSIMTLSIMKASLC